MNQELREIINDNSLGKLLVRIKPRFNQEIKNQNLANLLVKFNPPSPFFLKRGEVNIVDYLNKKGESEKLEKGEGSMVQGQVLLKACKYVCVFECAGGEGGTLFIFNFSRFINFTYRDYIPLCKTVL